jgi:hypothetical protein
MWRQGIRASLNVVSSKAIKGIAGRNMGRKIALATVYACGLVWRAPAFVRHLPNAAQLLLHGQALDGCATLMSSINSKRCKKVFF